jgi:SAM-dependent methyltransferase
VLTSEQDAQGRAIRDFYEGEANLEIIERDDGYIEAAEGPQAYLSTYDDWPASMKEALQYVRGRVLDVGCGAGRHALYLQEQGLDVLGLDVSPLALEVARKRGLVKTALLSITQLSRRLGTFDTIIMFGNNFGLFANPRRAKWLLRKFHGLTSARGRIVAQTLDPYQTDRPEHLAYHERNRKRGRMGGQVRIRVRYRRYATPWFDYLFVSRDEMHEILEDTVWGVKRFIDTDGPIYIAVIEKEGAH